MITIAIDGEIHEKARYCPYCNMSTLGEHESKCPNATNFEYFISKEQLGCKS